MNKTLKLIALALVAIMLLTPVACSNNGAGGAPAATSGPSGGTSGSGSVAPTPGGSGAAGEPEPEQREPVTVKYWYPMHVNHIEDDFVDAPGDIFLQEATGVTIVWEPVPDASKQERYNLMMASGDIPDIVGYSIAEVKRYVEAWMPLDDFILGNPRYANLEKYVYQDEYLATYLPDAQDGKNRIIPMLATRRIGDIIMVREDLHAQYGLPADLVTLEDWHEALTKAKEDGKIPYMTRQKRAGILYRLMGGFIDCMQEEYYVDDQTMTVKYGVFEDRYKEAVEIARQWYAEGLIDPEYPSTDATRWWEQVLAGNVYATHDNIMRISSANKDFIESQGIDARFIGMGPMQSPVTGTRNTTIHYPRVRHINAVLSVSTKYAERILDMFDYIFSDDGFVLVNWGIEGYSFEMVDGMPVTMPEYTAKVDANEIKGVGITRDAPKNQRDELIYDYNQGYEYDKNTLIARDLYNANDFIRQNWLEPLSFVDEERQTMTPIETELDTYRGEMLDKFIMGIEPMENWDAFLEALRSMGVQTNIDIYQAALERVIGN